LFETAERAIVSVSYSLFVGSGMTAMNLGNKGRVGIVASLLAAIWGCSDMAPANDTYQGVFGLSPTGGAGGDVGGDTEALLNTPQWQCLGKAFPMVPRAANSTRIKYRVAIGDFDYSTPIPGLVVQACTTTNCEPIPSCPADSTPTPTQACAIVTPPSQALPVYTIDLPYGFNGGLKLTEPTNYVEMDYFFGGLMVGLPDVPLEEGGDTVVGLPIPVIKKSTRQRVYEEVGVPEVDATRGVLAVRTLNCLRQPATGTPTGLAAVPQGQRADGVALEAVPKAPDGAVSWTLSNGNSFTKNRLVTDARGVAGFLNAPSENTDVFAVLPDGVTTIQANPTTIRVRADVITLAELRPGLEAWGQ
jgi:hypothetical protein